MSAPFVYADGGRADAGFEGDTHDCVTRALVNFRTRHQHWHQQATAYLEAYAETIAAIKIGGHTKRIPAGTVPGVPGDILPDFIKLFGFREVSVPDSLRINVGQFATFLPNCLIYVRGHITAVAGGRVLDTWDPRRRLVKMVWVDLGDQEQARRAMRGAAKAFRKSRRRKA